MLMMNDRVLPVLLAVAVRLLLLLAPCWAAAHPVDEVVQGAYLTLAPGEVRLELDLTPGTEVSGAVLRSLDANTDRRVSDAEARAYAEQVLKQSSLTLDGVSLSWRLERVSVPPYQSLSREGDTLKIYAIAMRAEQAGVHTLSYVNRYQPAKSQCIANIFLQPGAGWRYQVDGQQHSDDGRLLTVRYAGARA
jgi:hypothetical protein